jgi:putative sigma-54 modulation protein
MNRSIQTVHFSADRKLIEHIEKKLEKLSQQDDHIIQVTVFLKLDNIVHHIKDKVAEIRVHVPGRDLFVKSVSKSFEGSFDMALDSMINLVKKQKERQSA